MTAPHMPMMNDEGLLECPFCGGNSFVKKLIDGFAVECSNCNCTTGSRIYKDIAIYRWNLRSGHLYTPEDFKQAGQERDL